MGLMKWLKSLFGFGSAGVDDPAVAKLADALAAEVTISKRGFTEMNIRESTRAMAEEFGELHRKHPGDPKLHYAYAAALQLNLLGKTAGEVLSECVKAHPQFWIAALTLTREGFPVWNPFLCPEFEPGKTPVVHEAIDGMLTKALLLPTRCGVLPRAAIFHRDAADELSVSDLQTCKIEVATTISPVTDPRVVAINARIHDDPGNPFGTEMLACPFTKSTDPSRFAYELFARQDDFDIVIVDPRGKVKYTRRMTPSSRMQAVHGRLATMFDQDEGRENSRSDVRRALERHTATVDLSAIAY